MRGEGHSIKSQHYTGTDGQDGPTDTAGVVITERTVAQVVNTLPSQVYISLLAVMRK